MSSPVIQRCFAWFVRQAWKLGLFLFILLPVLWAMLYSLGFSLGMVGRLSSDWTLQHWHKAIAEGFLLKTILHSLYVAVSVTVVVGSLSLSVAVFFPQWRKSRLLLAMLLVQSGTPAVVVATQTMNWGGGGGFISRLAFQAGWLDSPNSFPSIVQDELSLGVILGISLTLLPLAQLYFMNLWVSVGFDRYCQLAEQLGCGHWQAKVKVALPMMLNRGTALLVLIFLLALGSYEIPLLLGRQSPQMFSVAAQQRASQFNLLNRPQAFALATVYFMACSSLLVVYFRQRRIGHER